MEQYLIPTFYFDFEHPNVQNFVRTHIDKADPFKTKAIKLFAVVRDQWMYSPKILYTKKEEFKASNIMTRSKGHCIDKAMILISCYRAVGIPARMRLAKVINHIFVEQALEMLGAEELTPHASVQLFLEGRWLEVTPAFNQELCDRLNVATLEFDGTSDSIFQQYSKDGNQFMEYLEDYGDFEDYPYDFVKATLIEHYPMLASLYGE